jgi:hypothetical protein
VFKANPDYYRSFDEGGRPGFDTMERKGIAVVTAELIERGLKGGSTSTREEQALRMRYGARVDPAGPLPSVAQEGSELADELLLIEMRLLSALKRRAAQAKGKDETRLVAASKAKIVSSLKKKR